MKNSKHPTSIWLSPTATRLRKLLAERLGVSLSAVMEIAIRLLAKREGVEDA